MCMALGVCTYLYVREFMTDGMRCVFQQSASKEIVLELYL